MIQKFLIVLSFFTRIPVGKRNFSSLTLADLVAFFPIAGAIIGLLDGGFYLVMLKFGLSASISAWLTVIFHLLLTGGLHEDGLADTADGLASGRNREQKLAIMHDSRIGSYGVIALVTIISLRANIIASFDNSLQILPIFIVTAACSRSLLAVFMRSVVYARSDGLAVEAGKPALAQTTIAISLGVCSLLLLGKIAVISMAIFALIIIYIIIRWIVIKNFGGITGDTLGAAQQISEIALLIIGSSMLKNSSSALSIF